MKSKLQETYPKSEYRTLSSPVIYVADFRLRSENERGVEIHPQNPLTPDGTGAMDCLKLFNDEQLHIEFSIFDDSQFKKEEDVNKDDEHCECCFFSSEAKTNAWISFVEIKDCKPNKISTHKQKAKEQIISTVGHFKKEGIVDEGINIYGIISFPRRTKTAFNDYIIHSPLEMFEMKKKYGILFLPTNTVKITSEKLEAL